MTIQPDPDGAAAAELIGRLPIDPWEIGLYERLMELPHKEFSALFAEILLGNLSVHDTAPLLDGLPVKPPSSVGLRDALAEKINGRFHSLETSASAGTRLAAEVLDAAGMNRGYAAWLETEAEPARAETAWNALTGTDAVRKREQTKGVRLAGP